MCHLTFPNVTESKKNINKNKYTIAKGLKISSLSYLSCDSCVIRGSFYGLCLTLLSSR